MPSVTRKQSSGREQRRDETLAKIRAAILPLLKDGVPFTELSVEKIVQEAGISRTTFYVYFEDKGDLVLALSEDALDAIAEADSGWYGLPPELSREQLREALGEIIRIYADQAPLMQAVVEVAAYDDRVRSGVGRQSRALGKSLEKHVKAGVDSGWVREEIDPKLISEWLVVMAERGFHHLVAPRADKPKELERYAESLTTVVWNTLYEGAPKR